MVEHSHVPLTSVTLAPSQEEERCDIMMIITIDQRHRNINVLLCQDFETVST